VTNPIFIDADKDGVFTAINARKNKPSPPKRPPPKKR